LQWTLAQASKLFWYFQEKKVFYFVNFFQEETTPMDEGGGGEAAEPTPLIKETVCLGLQQTARVVRNQVRGGGDRGRCRSEGKKSKAIAVSEKVTKNLSLINGTLL
jgi:hypothetical protein